MTQAKKIKQPYEKYFDLFALEVSESVLRQAEGILNQLSVEVPEVAQRLKNKSPRMLGESLTLYCTWLNCHYLWLRREEVHRVLAEQVIERIWANFYDDLTKEMKYSPIKEQLHQWQEEIELQCLEYGLNNLESKADDEAYRSLAAQLFKKIQHPSALYDDEQTLNAVSKILKNLETYVHQWNDDQAERTQFTDDQVIRVPDGGKSR